MTFVSQTSTHTNISFGLLNIQLATQFGSKLKYFIKTEPRNQECCVTYVGCRSESVAELASYFSKKYNNVYFDLACSLKKINSEKQSNNNMKNSQSILVSPGQNDLCTCPAVIRPHSVLYHLLFKI